MIKKYFKYVKELFNLAMPIIMGNLGVILIGAGDVFVAAKHSTNTLASISIANSITGPVFMLGLGLLVSISPLLSNFRGAKNNVKKYFLPTINFAMILAFLSLILILLCIPLIDKIGFEPVLIPVIKKYMFICSFSVFGAYLQIALKEYLQTFEIIFFPNFLNILEVFLNLFLNFVFVFGLFGFPEMGTAGLAVSTLLCRTFFGLWLLLYCLKFLKIRMYKDWRYFVNLLKIGFPISMGILLESFAFNLITIIIGRVSGIYAASQNILFLITTTTFMIPLGISSAVAVKVGYANGAGNFTNVKKYSISGIIVSVGFMAICGLSFILFPGFFVKIFTQDPAVIKISVPIMLLAGLFQVFDGIQVSLGGVFKGLKKTNVVILGIFGAYWLAGLPLGLILAFKYNMMLYGFWVGLTISIFSLAIFFLFFLFKEFEKIKKLMLKVKTKNF